jgi:hypothetical protein
MHVWYHLVGKWQFSRLMHAKLAAMPTEGKRKSTISNFIIPSFIAFWERKKKELDQFHHGKTRGKREFDT